MKTKCEVFGLNSATVTKLQSVLDANRHVDCAVLYGSRALGTYKAGSDIDLTLKGTKLGFDDLLQLETEFDDLMTPYSFDLSIFNQLENQELIAHINRMGIAFYERGSESKKLIENSDG